MPSKIVTNPDHYNTGEIECITYLRDNLGEEGFLFYCEGNIKKYLHRWRYKNKLEDLEKAQWYLEAPINGYTATEDARDGIGIGDEVPFQSRRNDGDG